MATSPDRRTSEGNISATSEPGHAAPVLPPEQQIDMLKGRLVVLQRENASLKQEVTKLKEPASPGSFNTSTTSAPSEKTVEDLTRRYNQLYVEHRKLSQQLTDAAQRHQKERQELHSNLHHVRMELQKASSIVHAYQGESQQYQHQLQQAQEHIYSLQQQQVQYQSAPPPAYGGGSSTGSVPPHPSQTGGNNPETSTTPPLSDSPESEAPADKKATWGPQSGKDKKGSVGKKSEELMKSLEKAEALNSLLQREVAQKNEELSKLKGTGPAPVDAGTNTDPVAFKTAADKKSDDDLNVLYESVVRTVASVPTSKPIAMKLVSQKALQAPRWGDEDCEFEAEFEPQVPVPAPAPSTPPPHITTRSPQLGAGTTPTKGAMNNGSTPNTPLNGKVQQVTAREGWGGGGGRADSQSSIGGGKVRRWGGGQDQGRKK